ncbi:MAG: MgtC/SapB family protein [Ruminococcaceae bacterium]|nr:MgtC/SapB family protein [Oscillospiraceae bacterium]
MVTLSIWDMLLRVGVAVLCGGVIGIERGRKRRPAGFRTYMLVCVGAAMTMILSTYLAAMLTGPWAAVLPVDYTKIDVSRFGAQVINGIGFLGAGTIIVTGRQQIKGMTTAAGLWASACMGLAIGAGFYMASLICCVLIILTVVVFSKLEHLILSRSRNINLYVEFENTDDISDIVERIKSKQVKIFDVEVTKAKYSESKYPNAIFSLQLPKKMSHTVVMTAIAEIESVRSIEEL